MGRERGYATEFFTLLGTGYDFHVGDFTFGPSLSAFWEQEFMQG